MSHQPDDVVDQVKEFIEHCVATAHLNISCQCSLQDGLVKISLEGEDRDLLLRENARLLYAINHLVNQAFFRRYQRQYNYLVDCQDYRGTRVMELQLLAQKAAERVRASGRPFRLQPMPSSERRVIHLALAEEEGVRTESQGSGRYRRVIIEPA